MARTTNERDTDLQEAIDRLEEIRSEMKELVGEAYQLVDRNGNGARAKGYWYAHILTALDDQSEFMGRSMCSMQDSQREMEEDLRGDDEK